VALLLVAALAALLWASGPWDGAYRRLWAARLPLGAGAAVLRLDLHGWVNDGLMALFFFVVGLEIRREVVRGELREPRAAAMPALAAAGGMAVPALVFLVVTRGTGAGRGWAIPMATDIAFAVGVLALLGRRVPASVRLFVLTLAVVDDLGAILVIALFYTSGLHARYLAAALALTAVLGILRRAGVQSMPLYIGVGAGLWLAVRASGVHPTVAGVVLALFVPAGRSVRLEDRLRPWTTFLVLPLFALANAGVRIRADVVHARGATPVLVGVVVGLVLGKVVGITGAARLAARIGLGHPPGGASWSIVAAAATVAGIGFTVSLFIAELAYPPGPVQDAAKLGVLTASLVAGTMGALAVRAVAARTAAPTG